MTDKQLELAARKYCEIVGLNPEEPISVPNVNGRIGRVTFYRTEKQWEVISKKLILQHAVEVSIKYGLSCVNE